MKEVSLLCVLCHQLPWTIQQRANNFLVFLLQMKYLQKLFLLSFMHSLTQFLPAQTAALYSSQDTCACFCVLYASFSPLILVRIQVFVHPYRHSAAFDYLHIAMGQCWAWKRQFLKFRQLSCTPLQEHILKIFPRKSLHRQKTALQRLRWSCFLPYTLPSGPWTPPSLQPKVFLTFTSVVILKGRF